jgi:hypothetical protein
VSLSQYEFLALDGGLVQIELLRLTQQGKAAAVPHTATAHEVQGA